ncbi:MAG: hypothetical protein LQ347_005114 [Umbilicaria vellea]|nr:MAG: hypothetical protein LQ347_005114 [Umbilicaria vellea]
MTHPSTLLRFFSPRNLETNALTSRFKPLDRQNVIWCALRSSTFVIISATQTIGGDGVYHMLVDAALDQLTTLERDGDAVIPTGVYDRLGPDNLVLHIWNANNHQLTRGVLAAALDALADFIDTYWSGALQFYIWDGQHEVAQGLLGLGG